MLASQNLPLPEFDARVPAMFRKYIIDDAALEQADPSQGWVRLRTPPDPDWQRRLDATHQARKAARIDGQTSLWMDDALRRNDGMFTPNEENVSIIMARLASPRLDALASEQLADLDEDVWDASPFPPGNLFQALPRPDARATAKELVRTIVELRVAQLVPGDLYGKDLRDVLLHRATHLDIDFNDAIRVAGMPRAAPQIDPVTGGVRAVADPLARLTTQLTAFLDTLHEAIPPPLPEARGDFVARWYAQFPGVAGGLMLDAYGIDFASTLLELRGLYPRTIDIERLVAWHAWLAWLATQPFGAALPALSDMTAFAQVPAWDAATGRWVLSQDDTSFVAPAAAAPDMLAEGDDVLYRALVAQRGRADASAERVFRLVPTPIVPPGWSWPATDPAFVYWWRAVLHSACATHALLLPDSADFHVAELVRFAYLLDLFGPSPSTQVPRYVAACIKASLLHFKYWFDEPPGNGNKGHEMTFWSENHQVLFHSSQFLVGQLFPDDVFPRAGVTAEGQPVTGRVQLARGRERLERWLDHRLAFGFSEWCSPGYYNEDFPPVLNVVDFARDERMATKAAMVADILVFDLARNTCRGSFGVTAGRAYFGGKAYGWAQSVSESIELLFGTRQDHLRGEDTAIALCTSPRYTVPDALLAIGQDRRLVDTQTPMAFRSRVSINVGEGPEHGIGYTSDADAAFWWGLGAYFDPATLQLTRDVASRHDNLKETTPLALIFKLDLVAGFLNALLIDAAEVLAGGIGTLAGEMLIFAPFPVNLVAAVVTLGSLQLAIEGVLNLLVDLASMLIYGVEAVVNLVLGEDPPKPKIPKAALQQAYEALLVSFNAGNVLGRTNLYTYSAGDVMLSSAQNHMAQAVSLQKHPWAASLGCDACVWTNAPLQVSTNLASAGWEVFKHIITVQASKSLNEVAALAKLGLDEMKEEGLRDWGGSICLPKVMQYRSVTIAAYNFPLSRSEFSATYSHAWFPTEFFDRVDPVPSNEEWLPEREGGGTWVFGKRDDGYVALCSARRVKWVRDERFKDDPDPLAPGKTMGDGRFMTTELRAEDGSNIWVCAVGTRTQFGSFEAFASRVRSAYLHFSGIGSPNQLQCTFDMPDAPGTDEPGFRWELFFSDDEAHLDGASLALDEYPRFAGRYVEGRTAGRVEWGEHAYRIVHPVTGLWVRHDTTGCTRETSAPQPVEPPSPFARSRRKLRDAVLSPARAQRSRPSTTATPASPAPPAHANSAAPAPGQPVSRKQRFRLAPAP